MMKASPHGEGGPKTVLALEDKQPYLFIVAGPTGSGKGSLPEKLKEYVGLDDSNQKIVKILIDDLVENNPTYKDTVLQIVRQECNTDYYGDPTVLCDKMKQKLKGNISQDLLDKFNIAYSASRFRNTCDTGCPPQQLSLDIK